MIVLVVGIHDHDLVGKKLRGLGPPVGDQGLDFGQFQLEWSCRNRPTLALICSEANGPSAQIDAEIEEGSVHSVPLRRPAGAALVKRS